MKRADLFRAFARVIDLCEGTPVKPLDCVKIGGNKCCLDKIYFIDPPDQYTFALAIVEDKPVFAGDVLYCRNIMFSVTGFSDGKFSGGSEEDGFVKALSSYCSWTKPDPFSELLKAHAAGKRVVFYDGAKWVDTAIIDTVNYKPGSYRVAEEDDNVTLTIYNVFRKGEGTVKVNFKKCGITGTISAEAIE